MSIHSLFDLSLPATCDSAAAYGIGGGDFQVIVGQTTTSGVSSAISWTAGIAEQLTPLVGGPNNDAAYGASIIALISVGRSNGKPCVWFSTAPHQLSTPVGCTDDVSVTCYCITPDGTKVGGSVNDGVNQIACWWEILFGGGGSYAGNVLHLLPSGGTSPLFSTYESVYAISDDGAFKYGGTDGATHAGVPCYWDGSDTLHLLPVAVGGESGLVRGVTTDTTAVPQMCGHTASLGACVWHIDPSPSVSQLAALAGATASDALGSTSFQIEGAVIGGWNTVAGVTIPVFWDIFLNIHALQPLAGNTTSFQGQVNAVSPDGAGLVGEGNDARSADAALWWFRGNLTPTEILFGVTGGLIAVEQSRTTLELETLPYTVPQPFGAPTPFPPGGYYHDTATLQYGVSQTFGGGVGVSIPTQTLWTLGQLSATETKYRTGMDADNEVDWPLFNVWGGRAFYSNAIDTGGLNSTEWYYNVSFVEGTTASGITYHTISRSDGQGYKPTPTPFSWVGLLPSVVCINTQIDITTGIVTGKLYDAVSAVVTTPIATFPSPTPSLSLDIHARIPFIKPDVANNQNLFLLWPGGSSMYCVGANNTNGTNNFSNYLSFSESDVNTVLCSNDTKLDLSWLVTPDAWYVYANRVTWETDFGTSPTTNGGVLVKISSDFTKYWLYYLTWKPGDTTAQTTLDNPDDAPTIVFGGGVIYYQDNNLYAGPILSFTLTPAVGSIGETYFAAAPAFYDLSVPANRAKFHDASGNPVDLGVGAKNPTGVVPAVFLSRQGGPPADFATNVGTGGSFTVSGGTLDDAGSITGS